MLSFMCAAVRRAPPNPQFVQPGCTYMRNAYVQCGGTGGDAASYGVFENATFPGACCPVGQFCRCSSC